MSKILVLYYSEFGYVAIVAHAIAEGARSAGATVDIKRVPGDASLATTHGSDFNPVHDDPLADIEDLQAYDAIIVGSPTRFGRLSAPVAAFLDQVSELTSPDLLKGKVGGAFASPANLHGGHETTSMSIITNLLHLGMVVIGPPYSATALAENTGQRHPSALDLDGAKQQGRLIAQTAAKLSDRGESGAVYLEPRAAPAAAGNEIEVIVVSG